MPKRRRNDRPLGIRPSTQLSRKGLASSASLPARRPNWRQRRSKTLMEATPSDFELGFNCAAQVSGKAWSGGGGGGGKRSMAFWIL